MTTADRERLERDHAEQLLSEDRRVAAMAGAVRRRQGLGALAHALKDLRATLVNHFAGEEEPDGFFDVIIDRAPVFIGRVEQLRHEHTTFLRDVDLILDRVRACLVGPVAEIMRDAAALAERIERHEAREGNLLGDAMRTDIGAGDNG
jgi:hemerythrin HHE cation binding domain-containing protein